MRRRQIVKFVAVGLALAVTAAPLRERWPGVPVADPPALQAQGVPAGQIYLPLIGRGAIGFDTSPPPFAIISPIPGSAIAGPITFEAQPADPAAVASVAFRAGGVDLGVDPTGSDGFRVDFSAGDFPAGDLVLTAIATGRNGAAGVRTATVRVQPNPPPVTVITSTEPSGAAGAGATLGTASGGIVIVPPGAARAGTTITATDQTKEEIKTQTGVDYDALGVTFLGGIDVTASDGISRPLGVNTAGFGNRVRPGEAVVTFRIVPDRNGDGIGELIVVNGARTGPADSVLSDPAPEIVLRGAGVGDGGLVSGTLQTGLTAAPGQRLTVAGSGFNVGSLLANVGVFKSLVDGREIVVPGSFAGLGARPVTAGEIGAAAGQAALTVRTDLPLTWAVPTLPPGPATLTVRNDQTGSAAAPIPLTIQAAPALDRPAAEIVDNYLARGQGLIAGLNPRTPAGAHYQAAALAQLTTIRTDFQQLRADPRPEVQQALRDIAIVIQGSGILNRLPSEERLSARALTEGEVTVLILIWGGVLLTSFGVAIFGSLGVAAAIFLGWIVLSLLIIAYMLYEHDYNPCNPSLLRQLLSGIWNTLTGAGSAPPSGGAGCGTAFQKETVNLKTPESGVEAAGLAVLPDHTGRFMVRAFSGNGGGRQISPFTGVSDRDGYFFIPLIPAGAPFVAVAFDSVTGQSRSFHGTGPAVGDGIPMIFDFSAPESQSPPVTFGRTITTTLAAGGTPAFYTLEGRSGDQILARLAAITGTLTPRIEIYRPDGREACAEGTFSAGLQTLCRLDTTGTHLVVAGDYSGRANPGTVGLQIWRTNALTDATPIDFGATLTGTIPVAPEGDVFRFTGAVSDTVVIRLTATAGALTPWAQIFRPDGTRLCQVGTFSESVDLRCQLDAPGAHTILAGDYALKRTGAYAVHLQRANNPVGAIPIAPGNLITRTIAAGELAVATFAARTGDRLVFRAARTAGTLTPWIQVYQADGAAICQAGTFSPGLQADCTIRADGTHTLLIGDYSGTRPGDLALEIQRANAPAGATAIAYGEARSGRLGPAASAAFTLAAQAGDQLIVRAGRTAGTLTPYLNVYRPDGTRLCSSGTFSDGLEMLCRTDTSGEHAIVVSDYSGPRSGDFGVFVQRGNAPAGATSLPVGTPRTAEIAAPAALAAYTFEPIAGDRITVTVTRTIGTLTPWVRFFAPDGAPLCSNGTFSAAIAATCPITATGTHAVLIGDYQVPLTGTVTVVRE